MSEDKFILPQGMLYISDLPDFIGIKPNSVTAHKYYEDECNWLNEEEK